MFGMVVLLPVLSEIGMLWWERELWQLPGTLRASRHAVSERIVIVVARTL